MAKMVGESQSVTALIEELRATLEAAQDYRRRCIIFINQVELLFLILENKLMFLESRQEEDALREVLALLTTLLQFRTVQVICVASAQGHQRYLRKSNSFAKELSLVKV
uniref:Uncharacterized protein n=1 Tax=Erythrolobus australicus TaxID=1077150 RepID=A0A7S1TMU1_9RHOD|mmetsp:Transcript_863/g.2382  ORF Transcript_863/g.2382 Transcript_863/m.2382 type:complete len:109 (+) Transcript_863:81-407(+)